MERPILSGDKVVLRPITPQDAPAMFASLADPELLRLTGTRQTFTYEQVLAHCQRIQSAEDRVDYAITLPGDPAYLGEVVLNEIDEDNRCANFRIALARTDLTGRGLGTEAARLIVDFGFCSLGLHRIELEVYAFNPRARRSYEKAGFMLEGTRRDALLWEGVYYDALIMSILNPEG